MMDLCKCGTAMKKGADGKCAACGKMMAKSETTGVSSDFGSNPESTDKLAVVEKGIPGADPADPETKRLDDDGDAEGKPVNTSDDAGVEASNAMLKKGEGLKSWLSKAGAMGPEDDDGDEDDEEKPDDDGAEGGSDDLEKSRYLKRTGSPGHYRYTYPGEPESPHSLSTREAAMHDAIVDAKGKDAGREYHAAVQHESMMWSYNESDLSDDQDAENLKNARAQTKAVIDKHLSADEQKKATHAGHAMAADDASKLANTLSAKAKQNKGDAYKAHFEAKQMHAAAQDAHATAAKSAKAAGNETAARLHEGKAQEHAQKKSGHDEKVKGFLAQRQPIGTTKSGKSIASGHAFEKKSLGGPTFGVHTPEDRAKFDKDHESWSAQDHKDAVEAHFQAQGSAKKEVDKDRHYAMQMAHMKAADAKGGVQKSTQRRNDMSGFQKGGLSEWMKSNIPGAEDTSGGQDPATDLPRGEPAEDLQPGKGVNGPMLALAGMGEDSTAQGKPNTLASTTGAANPGDTDKLSEDDPDFGQMASGAPGLVSKTPETGNVGQGKGDLSKSTGFIPDAADQQLRQAQARALAARGQGPADLTGVGVGRASPAQPKPAQPAPTIIRKGQVIYSDAADREVEALLKSEGAGALDFVGNAGPLQKSEACGACGTSKPVWLSTCPECGSGSNARQLVKSQIPQGRLRLRVERDEYLPNGTKKG